MDGTIFDSDGHRIAVVIGASIFALDGQKLYDLPQTILVTSCSRPITAACGNPLGMVREHH